MKYVYGRMLKAKDMGELIKLLEQPITLAVILKHRKGGDERA